MIGKLKFLNIIFLILFFHMFFDYADAQEPILISISSSLDKVIFDGKWTDPLEWKQSSYNKLYFEDGSMIHLRTAHQDNFIYVQINFETDQIIDKGSDSAMVCFDTKNDKTVISQPDDYCFLTIIDVKRPITFQGNNISLTNGSFNEITNDKNFIAVGSASDKFDRYNKIPHASYEFRIPLDMLGRSDNYGFFVSVFDGDSQNHYSWPYEIKNQSLSYFSSPSQWGDLISPDKSLPEFNSLTMFYLVSSFMIIFVIITKFNVFKICIFRY